MRFKKTILTGALAIGVMAGAGSAYAAPASNANVGDQLSNYISAGSGFSLNSLNDFLNNLQNQGWNVRVVYPQTSWNTPNSDNGNGNGYQCPSYGYDWGASAGQGAGTNEGQDAGAGAGQQTGTNPGQGAGSNNGSAGTVNDGGNGSAGDTATTASAYADQVVSLVNQERAKAGLKPLASDSALTKMALDKAKDMYNNNYFDHNSPTYGSPFDMMKSYGISYSYAGENIAKGQRNPQEVMDAWMNSAGHRQNIMSPNYTKIGVAYYNGEWVQEFIAN